MKNKVYIQHLHKINMTEDCNDGNLYIPYNLKKKNKKKIPPFPLLKDLEF